MPCNRQVKTETVSSLFNLEIPFEKHLIIATRGYTIAENRNYIVATAIRNGCTHLLFVDDDMVFPPETLRKLLDGDLDIYGTIAHPRDITNNTTVVDKEGKIVNRNNIPKFTFECSHLGGIFLIKLDIFKHIPQPWFATEADKNGFTTMGEDAYFCKKAIESGYKIWCNPSIKIGHIGDFSF